MSFLVKSEAMPNTVPGMMPGMPQPHVQYAAMPSGAYGVDKLHCCRKASSFLGLPIKLMLGKVADILKHLQIISDIRHLHLVWQLLKWYHIHEWRIPVHLVTTGDKHRGRWANFMGATVKMIRLDYLQSSPWILTIEFGMRQSQLFVDLTYPLCITVPFFTVVWFFLLQDLQQ